MPLIFVAMNSFVGFSFLNSFGFVGYKIEKIALGFLLSLGAFTYLHFLVSKHTNIVTLDSFYLLFSLFVAVLIGGRLILKKRPKELKYKLGWFSAVCWLCIILLWVLMTIYTANTPIWNADTIHLYDFRALVMHQTKTFNSIETIQGWFNYPLFTTNILLFSRYIGLSNPGPLFPLFYLCFAVIFFSILHRSTTASRAALGTLMMFATPLTLWQTRDVGLTNLVYSIFISSSVFYLIEGLAIKKGGDSFIFVSSLLLCIAIWCRMLEPLWIVPLSLIIFGAFVKKKPIWFSFIFLFLLFRYTWVNFVSIKTINFETTASGMTQFISNHNLLINAFNKMKDTKLFSHVLKALTPAIYVFASILIVNLLAGIKRLELLYLYCIFGIVLVLFSGTLFFASFVPGWDNSIDSVARLVSVLPPLMWMFIFKSHVWNHEKNHIIK